MSEVGLNSNIYDVSSKYLGILNRFLVEANYDPSSVPTDSTKKVHAFLRQLLDKSNRDFQVQMVDQIIRAYLQKHRGKEKAEEFLKRLLHYFDQHAGTDADALQRISLLTEALDEECDEAFSRMRLGK
jgi:hypothetical protein